MSGLGLFDFACRIAIRNPSQPKLSTSRLDQFRVDVEADVVVWIEVRNKTDASTQAAAANIEEAVAGRQPLGHQVVELYLPHFLPQPADSRPMLVCRVSNL